MAAGRERCHTHQQHIFVDGLGAAGLAGDADSCGRVHVFDAKDHDDALGGPASGADQQNDALDDAHHVRLLHDELSQRTGALLGRVQLRRDDNTGLRYRLGPTHRHAEIQARRTRSGGGGRIHDCRRAGVFRVRGDDERCGR